MKAVASKLKGAAPWISSATSQNSVIPIKKKSKIEIPYKLNNAKKEEGFLSGIQANWGTKIQNYGKLQLIFHILIHIKVYPIFSEIVANLQLAIYYLTDVSLELYIRHMIY